MGSTRLPGKPLREIAGRSLLEWVWRRTGSLPGLSERVIATDDPSILERARSFGARVVLTRGDHGSGTDRVAEVADRPEFETFDRFVNLQGDEPFLPTSAVSAIVGLLEADWPIGTVSVPIGELAEWRDPSIVKVVRDDRGGALYFSRAPIPHARQGKRGFDERPERFLRHVGVYGFTRESLRSVAALSSHPLEEIEGLEQLRWLAAGFRIGVAIVEGGNRGIDTEEDLERAEDILRRREEFP